ncbi:hypothetical protein BRADI_4g14582v3 [Brachypodium distachyon]|uniref:DUF629 domain-containing protein n=1 Tax=Brachypodium distachyon TaxID=15368 RepID=A0A2K2CMU7_BRADI|nr:hypothetical protein BRADI_4g14582v3 [Brachypodium distachyon]PNT63353.1 hypothetical protein BRADI_4g14582v3 [Brachypodium distachyon]
MVKPAAGAGAAADMRTEAKAAVMLDRDGHHDEALAHVHELAAGHPGSSVVLFAAALVHQANAQRAKRAADKEAAVHHLVSAELYVTEAKRLVPNCIDISALLARVLFEESKHDEADAAIQRAIEIPSPIDPAENNVMIDEDARANTTNDQRVENSREMARQSFRAMRQWMCDRHVPLVINKVLEVELDADDRKGAAQALKTANDLAKRCHYSARAQLFRAYMKLNFVRGLDATMDRRPFLDCIRGEVTEAVNRFSASIVLSMFRAKLCFVLGFYEDAYLEFLRAVFTIEQPVDPKLEDVPPGSVIGQERADRLSSINKEFANLIRRLLWVAKVCWDSMTSEEQDGFLSVRLVELQKYCDDVSENSHWAARTISDALSFVNKTRSWRFWICPYCVGKKLPDTGSLWRHMCSKHPAEKDLLMLQTVLDPNQNHDTSVNDNSSDFITVCQDSEDNYFFCFKKTDQIFELLFIPPSTVTQAVPFAEIREKKCKEGSEILEKMKQKLKNLPTDKISAEFDKARCKIQDLWCDFLSTSVLDYHAVMLPLAESFIWTKLIKYTSEDKASSKSIDNSDIDTVFPDVVHAPGSEMMLEYMCKYLDGNKNHECGDDQDTEDMKPAGFDKTIVDDEKTEESEALVEDGNSGTMLDKKSSDPIVDTEEIDVSKLAARIANVEIDKKGTSGQSSGEMASSSSCQPSVKIYENNNANKVLFSLRVIIQSLCNLKNFRDKLLTEELKWNPYSENPCIADILCGIFFAWERYEPYPTFDILTSVKNILCRLANDSSIYEKVGESFASKTVITILIELHMLETSLSFSSNTGSERNVVNPITCGDCICPTHSLFGINFDAQMSCSCGERSDNYLYTTLFHMLDAGSPQTTKIKSFAELQYILDVQFSVGNTCKHCGTIENVGLFLLNTPHCFTIVLNWASGSESQDTLSEVLAGISSPLDAEFFCRSSHSATKYIVASMSLYVRCYLSLLPGLVLDATLILRRV